MCQLKTKYTLKDKYEVVADCLIDESGTLLDIGARDRILLKNINKEKIRYYSADLIGKHDFTVNIENAMPFSDGEFDIVVALDVLEHLENIHGAFRELARITRYKLIIALPNMASIRHRMPYLFRGNLGTAKYDLPAEGPPADRHRWLTIMPEITRFVEVNANAAGLSLDLVVEQMESGRLIGRCGLIGTQAGIFRNGLFTCRCIYFLEKIRG